ncbi:MAG: PKD domain-containing protein, partial [Halococcoides sp.]
STDDSDDSTDDSDDSTDDTDDSDDDSDDSTDDTDDSDDSNDDTDDSADDKSDLVAEIDPDTTTPAVGEQVDFHITDTSGSGRWLSDLAWSLGDGTTQTGWHAGHSYESAGEYTVELEATASDGTTTTDAVTVEVGDDTSEDSSDDGEDDTSEDGSDDGEDDTSEDDTDDGDDDTSEDDTDDGEDDTSEDSSDDGEGSEETPHGEISASATTVSPGERVTFELTANESWLTGIEWDLDDGTTDSGSWHVTHSYDTAGTYTVSLETQSGQTGEWTTDTVTITVE